MPTEQDRVEVGRRIKRLRQAQGLSVQQLATHSSVSPGYLSEVERGLSAVSIDKLRQIAEGLKIPVEALFGGDSETGPGSHIVQIPTALSAIAERLNLSHKATLTLLQGQRSLTARRSSGVHGEWTEEEWMKFYDQVKVYLPEC